MHWQTVKRVASALSRAPHEKKCTFAPAVGAPGCTNVVCTCYLTVERSLRRLQVRPWRKMSALSAAELAVDQTSTPHFCSLASTCSSLNLQTVYIALEAVHAGGTLRRQGQGNKDAQSSWLPHLFAHSPSHHRPLTGLIADVPSTLCQVVRATKSATRPAWTSTAARAGAALSARGSASGQLRPARNRSRLSFEASRQPAQTLKSRRRRNALSRAG